MLTQLLSGIILVSIVLTPAMADEPARKISLVFDHELPSVPGKSMKGVLVEYGPSASSPAHAHPKSAFIYATVLEGAIRIQVNDGPVTVYHAGQHFIEMPGSHHRVSANASDAEPCKLLAVFVVDTKEKQLVTDDPITQ